MTEQPAPQPRPRVLADLDRLLAAVEADTSERVCSRPVWRLDEADRQLDAEVLSLAPSRRIQMRAEPELDVLVAVLSGDGAVHTGEGTLELAAHTLLWLPRGTQGTGSTHVVESGPGGLTYLTARKAVPRKGAALRIELPSDPEALRLLEAREEQEEGGEPACLLPRLCPVCGAPNERSSGQACSTCGAEPAR